MCGIAGIFGNGAGDEVWSMLASLRHRGPDSSGVVLLPCGALGACRLRTRGEAFEEVPHRLPDGSVVAYNGEIYGSVDTRGWYSTGIPTGGLPESAALLDELRQGRLPDGMFAAACVSANSLTLARDAFGIKPLFYSESGGNVMFGSEVAALLPQLKRKVVSRRAVREFLMFGSPLREGTFLEGLFKVSPSSWMSWPSPYRREAKIFKPHRRDLEFSYTSEKRPPDLRSAMRAVLSRVTDSGVPLGLAVSGGLDSWILAWELSNFGLERLHTISVLVDGVDDGVAGIRELALAGSACQTWEHVAVKFAAADVPGMLAESVAVMGQPFSMTSTLPYLKLAKAARDAGVVVLLIGEGADELFCGYESYHSWLASGQTDPLSFYYDKNECDLLHKLLGHEALLDCCRRFTETFPEAQAAGGINGLRAVERTLSLEPLLWRSDHCLMAHGVEGRTPFLHGAVPSLALDIGGERLIGNGHGKSLLREAYPEYSRRVGHRKRAFRLPVTAWFESNFREWVRTELRRSTPSFEALGLDPLAVDLISTLATSGNPQAGKLAFSLLTLGEWLNMLGNWQAAD